MRENTQNLVYDLKPPNVEVHCLYGVGVKTPGSFSYSKEKDFPDSQPSVTYDDGDGTVNIRSLLGYTRWIETQPQGVFPKNFTGLEHVATLKHPGVIEYILNLFLNK